MYALNISKALITSFELENKRDSCYVAMAACLLTSVMALATLWIPCVQVSTKKVRSFENWGRKVQSFIRLF